MKIETLKKDNKKKIAIGIIAVISIISTIILASSFAKYKLTESIPLANGTINYTVPDLNVLAMYQENEAGEYEKTDTIPESGYTFSSESYCATLRNGEFTKDDNITINYDMNTKAISVTPLTKRARCYLYFDKKSNAGDTILGDITPKDPTTNMFNNIATTDEGIYKAIDDTGKESYYYRGAVTNNYLRFANKWWRIIRINGDGTIRIIYDGTAYHANGTSTSDSIAVSKNSAFNSSGDDAIYVGFKYGTTTESRGLTNKSNALILLEEWYKNNLVSYKDYIDTNAGFCGDRTSYTNTSGTAAGTGYGSTDQYFADYVRLSTRRAPVLTCANTKDLYTVSGASKGNKSLEYPIGLINANEVAMAGGVYNTPNSNYYLYNGMSYWAMSPFSYYIWPYMFYVENKGKLYSGRVYDTSSYVTGYGLRPVINLRADVQISGSGTGTDPFVVN